MCTPSKSYPCSSRSNMSRKFTAALGSLNFKNGYVMQGKKRRMEEVEVKDESDNTFDSMKGKLNIIGMSDPEGSVRSKMCLSETPCELVQETLLLKKAKHNVKKDYRADIVDGNESIASLKHLGIYICNSRNSLSVAERQRAINVAKFYNPKNPSFLLVARDSNILRRSVYVPCAFARKFVSGDKLFTVQDSDGRELAIRTYWTYTCLLTGWAGFFKENDVKEGDILFFELIKKKDLLLKVSVFHA